MMALRAFALSLYDRDWPDADPSMIIAGFIVSVFVGATVLWLVVDKWLRPAVGEQDTDDKHALRVSQVQGMMERALYTGALITGLPGLVYMWLGIKVAVRWRRWASEKPAYNSFLIGTALSLAFGVIGAYIALGMVPTLRPL